MDFDDVTVDSSAPNDSDRDELLRLAAALNHHLRTPVTVLVRQSELLREHADALSDDQRRQLCALDDAVERLSDAISRSCRLLRDAHVGALH